MSAPQSEKKCAVWCIAKPSNTWTVAWPYPCRMSAKPVSTRKWDHVSNNIIAYPVREIYVSFPAYADCYSMEGVDNNRAFSIFSTKNALPSFCAKRHCKQLSQVGVNMDRLFCPRSHLRVIMPVQVLQVVGGQDVDIAAATNAGVVDYTFRIAALQQALQGFQPFARLFSTKIGMQWRESKSTRKVAE